MLQLEFPWRIIVLNVRVENLQPGRWHQNLLPESLKVTFVVELRILVSCFTLFTSPDFLDVFPTVEAV